MLKIAITGGLACGKSSACRFFKELGCIVVSADDIVHDLLKKDHEIGKKVIQLIGNEIVVEDQIDRSIIAKKVFDQPKLLKSLEDILHPAVRLEIEKQYQKTQHENAPFFIAEIPLLFETGAEKFFDSTIVVAADQEICKKRFSKGSIEFERRSKRQLSMEEKIKKADFIIENNDTLAHLQAQVLNIYHELIS